MPASATYRIGRNVAWRLVDGEVFAITANGLTHEIDRASGVAAWKRLDSGPASLDDLVDVLVAEFEVDRDTARKDCAQFVETLLARGLAVRD